MAKPRANRPVARFQCVAVAMKGRSKAEGAVIEPCKASATQRVDGKWYCAYHALIAQRNKEKVDGSAGEQADPVPDQG